MLSARATAPVLESAFLRLPAEIRHKVYQSLFPDQLHIHAQGDRLLISACLESNQNIVRDSQNFDSTLENSLIRHELELFASSIHGPVAMWSRRLGSTWGTHWKCEENASSTNSKTKLDTTLFRICWKIRSEILDLLARTFEIHVTDLEAVSWIENRTTTPSKPLHAASVLLLGVNHLNITLRLPLVLYQSLERLEDVPSQHPELAHPIDNWLRLGSTLRQLPNLSQLWVWLEHDKQCSWSVVHERATLSPLEQLSNSLSVNIHLSLPKLHPGLERQDRHFSDGEYTFFHLHRRVRQRFHTIKHGQIPIGLEFQPDFPFLLHLIEFVDLSVAEIEREERRWWRTGMDVESEIHKVNKWDYKLYAKDI